MRTASLQAKLHKSKITVVVSPCYLEKREREELIKLNFNELSIPYTSMKLISKSKAHPIAPYRF